MELTDTDQPPLAGWAADCAERVLTHFEQQHPDDARPRGALEAARGWTRGEQAPTAARMAACTAHAAAREVEEPACAAAARAASHAAATTHLAHLATQARQAADEAVEAVSAAHPGDDARATSEEREWQRHTLPAHLHFLLEQTTDPPHQDSNAG